MFFRKRVKDAESSPTTRFFGGREVEAPASVIGRNTRFRGEVRGTGGLLVRGLVEGSLHLQGPLSVAPGSSLRADVQAPVMVLAGHAEGAIRIHELLSVQPSATFQGEVECGRVRVEEGAVLRGTLRRVASLPTGPPEQSTP